MGIFSSRSKKEKALLERLEQDLKKQMDGYV